MYNLSTVDFQDTNQFSKLFIDYISQQSDLQGFYNEFPTIENFKNIIEQRQFSDHNRTVLLHQLAEQYKDVNTSIEVLENINSLAQPNTFTVTTGHQICLLTGPLYFIYKIVTTIKLAENLKIAYPEHNFVPVYWLASEDHDFEEINHVFVDDVKHTWDTQQKGAVGKFNTTDMASFFDTFQSKIPNLERFYTHNSTLAKATISLVNDLFQSYGLVCIDADTVAFKKLFIPYIKADIFDYKAYKLVQNQTKKLNEIGYQTQINGREINFFYLQASSRERIEFKEDFYHVLNTDIKFTKSELENLIAKHPERFSPNVVLRPLYQEVILPNLAYIGGPSELSYWLQLKSLFDSSDVNFPLLVPRNFVLLVSKLQAKKLKKLQIDFYDLFQDQNHLKRVFIERNTNYTFDKLNFINQIDILYDLIKEQASNIDVTLEKFVEAQRKGSNKIITKTINKISKAIESKEHDGISRLMLLYQSLFPANNLQERRESFLNFYLNNPAFIETLLQSLSPMNFKFNILTES